MSYFELLAATVVVDAAHHSRISLTSLSHSCLNRHLIVDSSFSLLFHWHTSVLTIIVDSRTDRRPAIVPLRETTAKMMKELRVEDALQYLDQVKMEFGDRPHIYNEFLDIMKTFKTQQIDTPGVIRRVSNLFQGNRRLVLGFNTFLPEGYKIEIPADGEGPPVAVFRAPGSTVTHVLNGTGTTTTTTTTTTLGNTGSSPSQPGSPSLAAQANSAAARALAGLPPAAPPAVQIPGVSLNRGPPQGARPAGVRGPDSLLGAGGQPPILGQATRDGRSPLDGLPGVPGLPPIAGKPGAVMPAAGAMQAAQLAGVGGGQPQQASPRQAMPPQQAQQAPLEFDHAINYVTTIKKRFANEPETYKKFLEILHTYQKEQRGINEVLDEVTVLFSEHPDLLKQFTYFLPDAVQKQAKARLDVAAREAEEKLKRIKMAKMAAAQQQPVQDLPRAGRPPAMEFDQRMHVPFGATQGRSPEEEKEIVQSAKYGNVSFAPVRPMKHPITKMGQAGMKPPRPRSIPEYPISASAAETAFFSKVKHHLSRKELMPEKTQGLKKNTPYTEFLKCIHLFGAGVLNKEEVILLLRGLFTQGHAPRSTSNNPQVAADATELLKEFETMMVGRGPYADQEEAKKNKSKYGSVRCRDMNFSKSAHPTPSYYAYPDDFPADSFLVHPSQLLSESQVLNSTYVSIPGKRSRVTESLEVYDGIKKRHNAYEDAMARVEDERYEIDMAIARNAQALVQIEPLAQEALALRQGEEKDGQPIGRLQYSLKKGHGISSVVINAIARVYGDRGDEVLQHLARNPLVVLPIVYQRLKQKHDEWRKIRDSLKDQWSAVTQSNYEGCMDVRCYYRRRDMERTFAADCLVEECKSEKPDSLNTEINRSATFLHSGLPDERALLFEPCLAVASEVGSSHHDAFQLISIMVNRLPGSAAVDLERIGRIWAEFMMPWYGYPGHWICDEVRKTYAGRLSHSVVLCKS